MLWPPGSIAAGGGPEEMFCTSRAARTDLARGGVSMGHGPHSGVRTGIASGAGRGWRGGRYSASNPDSTVDTPWLAA